MMKQKKVQSDKPIILLGKKQEEEKQKQKEEDKKQVHSSGEEEEEDEEDEEEEEEKFIPLKTCLFCPQKFDTVESSVEHMAKTHSFFIPCKSVSCLLSCCCTVLCVCAVSLLLEYSSKEVEK